MIIQSVLPKSNYNRKKCHVALLGKVIVKEVLLYN